MTALRIAQVASRSGVPASTLRYYDQLGLVPTGRAANGYRVYDEAVFDRLRFIDSARALDLPLDDVSSLLQVWEKDPCASVKAQLRPLLEEHLQKVVQTVDRLSELRNQLESARAHLDELPDRDDRCDPSCAFLLTDPVPVARDLGADRGEQVGKWRALLDGSAREEIAGGVRVSLPIGALSEAAALAASEQECCPFFAFDIALHRDSFTLTIRTPPEGRNMLVELTGQASVETLSS